MGIARLIIRWLLRRLYRVQVQGLEHYHAAGPRVLIVANHTSFLDALLLVAFLPDPLTFAINPHIARRWWLRPFLGFVDFFPLEPTRPQSLKSLIRYLRTDRRAVIFPEGRITVTGSLMKIYPGPGLVADKSGAVVLPVRIEGAQYTPFSYLRGRVRLRWFPPIRVSFLPPRRFTVPAGLRGRERRKHIGKLLADLMTEMMFATSNTRRTLIEALLDARRVYGGAHPIVEDIERKPVTYHQLIANAYTLGAAMADATRARDYVGVLLPNTVATVYTLLGLHSRERIPAMLNYTEAPSQLLAACATAGIRTLFTSRQFVQRLRLEPVVAQLAAQCRVLYLEDLRAGLGIADRLKGWLVGRLARLWHRHLSRARPEDPAVVLFTTDAHGQPQGVVLSHANLLANREQIATRIDFTAQDVILNALPMYHPFGLTAGTLLPLLSGMKVFFYPAPQHYRIVPEMAYEVNATILFGTDTYLAGYARVAHPYDFYSTRYVFAGGERLRAETRRLFAEKFGVQIFEGYGTTETGPVLATNTPMDNRPGSVGRLLPGIDFQLAPVPGCDGGRLLVRGPNVMLGTLRAAQPGVLQPTAAAAGAGWYDTGDLVSIDADGFVTLRGRAKPASRPA
jgi:acyl-[acyl-carrier-protein]-phospholipid O-acyltransferase/long-chain-fatty-acid--[acyl-carrier-protein] ligase